MHGAPQGKENTRECRDRKKRGDRYVFVSGSLSIGTSSVLGGTAAAHSSWPGGTVQGDLDVNAAGIDVLADGVLVGRTSPVRELGRAEGELAVPAWVLVLPAALLLPFLGLVIFVGTRGCGMMVVVEGLAAALGGSSLVGLLATCERAMPAMAATSVCVRRSRACRMAPCCACNAAVCCHAVMRAASAG